MLWLIGNDCGLVIGGRWLVMLCDRLNLIADRIQCPASKEDLLVSFKAFDEDGYV